MLETVTAIFNAAKAAWTAASTWQKVQMVATAVTLGTGVKAAMQAKQLLSKGQEILGQKAAQGGKIPVIYGRRRVGSTLALLHTHDGRSQNLVAIYALSVGEVDQIELDTIQINGVPIKDTKVFKQGYYAGSDKISSGAGSLCTASQIGVVQESNAGQSGTNPARRYRMVFNAHHGADDQTVDPMLLASVPEVITSNHRLRGIAYIAASFEYDTEGMFRSIPELTVVVKGKKLYDPRKDGSITGGSGSHRYDTPSTYEWSDNAALCLLDYLRDDEYGKGLASGDLNLQSFQTAANTSDELEDTPDYSGSASAATFSGTSGNNFITVDETTWKNSKIGGLLTLEDSGSATEFDQVSIIDALRYHEFEATNPIHQVVINDTLSSSYTNEVGTALVKVKRFHCNGVVDTNKNVLENTQELLANMRGILNYINGKYEITLEDTASSAFTVTDDHIIADNGITVNYEDKSQKANKVVVQFFNALKKYEMDTVTVFHDPNSDGDYSDYKSDDGGEELELVVDFPYIVNKYVAYNMGEAILGRSRNQTTISFTAVPELYKVKVGDVITISYTPLGFTGKLFRIEAMNLQPNGLIDIQAIEYLDIYTWTAPPQENIEDIARVPTGKEVKAPSGLSFTDTDSSSTGRPFISWNAITDFPQYEFRVSIVDSSANKVLSRVVSDNFVDLNFLPIGSNYVATVTTINGQQAESSGTTLTFSISNTPTKAADVDVAGVISAGSIIVSGDNVTTLSNNAGYVNSSQAASAAPVQSVAGATGAVAASTIISAGNIVVQGDNISTLTNNSNFIDGSQVNSNVTSISGGVIDTGTINSDRLNTNTLNVKHFDNVSTDIKSHTGSFFPLIRYGSAIRGAGGTTTYTGSNASFVPVTITQVRNNATYTAVLSAVLGNVNGGRVQYSLNNSTWVDASGGESNIYWNAGTYRGYVYHYQGQITTLSSSQSTVYWRVYFSGTYNHTHMQLHITMDNTT
tara:strand:+ start:5995 stop:8922 length:2928 start_codon:yes stop_codon:yes gene_type:complete